MIPFEDALSNAVGVSKIVPSIRGRQKEALQHFYNGKDTMILLPTGYGKSAIYMLTPFLQAAKFNEIKCSDDVTKIALIISPLNSIMKQQVQGLCSKGVPACYLDMRSARGQTYKLKDHEVGEDEQSDSDPENELLLEASADFEDIQCGKFLIIFTHPEALLSTARGQALLRSHLRKRICCVAIDEAHMVYEW